MILTQTFMLISIESIILHQLLITITYKKRYHHLHSHSLIVTRLFFDLSSKTGQGTTDKNTRKWPKTIAQS